MTRRTVMQLLDDHYWTARWLMFCAVAFTLALAMGGSQ